MRFLKDIIVERGQVFPGDVLKVDCFLNHQVDVMIVSKLAKEIYKRFKESGATKVLTIESSGIPLACLVALEFKIPFVFAKKRKTINLTEDLYKAKVFSYTTGKYSDIMIAAEYITPNDKVLIVDDFLANGSALNALIDIVNKAGAGLVGAAVAIEKGFQGGGDTLRQNGIKVESLAIIDAMSPEKIIFRD